MRPVIFLKLNHLVHACILAARGGGNSREGVVDQLDNKKPARGGFNWRRRFALNRRRFSCQCPDD
jgi:hypothetical protein